MPRLVWLASYPKSGNTWMRAFLTAYKAGPGVEIDLNALDASLHAASRQLFDRVIGFGSSDLTADEIDGLRPEVYRAFDAEGEDSLFLKVHDRWRTSPGGEPVFPAEVTRVAIVIVRNPLSVAPSLANHYGYSIDEAIEHMGDPEFGLAGQTTRLARQLPQPVGTWSQNVTSWLDRRDFPVLLVRYEDLRADPVAHFGRVLTACGIEPDGALLGDAMERSSFERLQRAEAEVGFRERMPDTPAFFRSGRTDGWREELTAEQVARIRADHADVMARLGYPADMDKHTDEATTSWTTPHLNTLEVTLDTALVLKTGSGGDATGVTIN